MTKKPITLFPHTYTTKRDLERILIHFAPLTIYQPWFMEGPIPGAEPADVSLVRVQNPPEGLRPDENFVRLLSEYQLWMSQNRDKGYATFLRATSEKVPSEDTPWEIRQMLRQMGRDSHDLSQENTLKWHLTLHLARQLEENRTGVQEMLERLKRQDSPLAGAIEDGASSKSLVQDLPSEETYPFVEKHHIRQVLEAWFGLFGGYLADHETLLTLSRPVMDYVTEMFEDRDLTLSRDSGKLTPKESDSGQVEVISKDLPALSENKNDRKNPILSHLSGKTIILLREQGIG